MKEYGHLAFIDNPDLNPNDKYAPARSFGMRSMLEVNIARHLDAAGGQMVTQSNWVRSKNHLVKIKAKLRSGLEDRVVEQLETEKFEYEYETLKLAYTIAHTYTPDLVLENGMIVECKGLFTSEDRSKHLAVKKAHPHLDIRFVFSRSKSPLYKGSKSTYASWCEQKGFKYADKLIPQAWLDEVKRERHDTDAANSQTPSQSRVDLAARSNH
jgi:hypothetical protein